MNQPLLPDREAVSHRVHTPVQAGSTPAPATHIVCPTCKRSLDCYRFKSPDGHVIETWRCPEHGDVAVPMRSAVVNRHPEPDWSAA